MITTIATVTVFVEDQDRAKGVQFLGEPQVQDWGSFAMLVDSEGNRSFWGSGHRAALEAGDTSAAPTMVGNKEVLDD